MSQAGIISASEVESSIELVGDIGTAAGPVITQTANTTAGSSVVFSNSGSSSRLLVTDALLNTIIGSGAGNGSITGTSNVGLGLNVFSSLTSGINNTSIGNSEDHALSSGSSNTSIGRNALSSLTTGGSNLAIGQSSLSSLVTGNFNIAAGTNSGLNYTSSESSNILIGNSGTISESNVMRLGTSGSGSGQVNSTYIAGINGRIVSNPVMIVMNSSTEQLGTVALNSGGISTFNDDFFTKINLDTWAPIDIVPAPIDGVANHPGIIQLPAQNAGDGVICFNSDSTNTSPVLLSSGTSYLTWIINLETLSDNVNTYIFYCGWGDNLTLSTIAPPINGLYFTYTNGQNFGNYDIHRISNSAQITFATNVPGMTGFVNYQIVVSGGVATFFINGTNVGSINTFIPTVPVCPFVYLTNTAGNTPNTDLDLCSFTLYPTR